MNTKIMYSCVILTITALAAWNIHLSSSESKLSDVSLANVEALAYELPEVVIECNQYEGACWGMDDCFNNGGWCGCEFTGAQADFCVYG